MRREYYRKAEAIRAATTPFDFLVLVRFKQAEQDKRILPGLMSQNSVPLVVIVDSSPHNGSKDVEG